MIEHVNAGGEPASMTARARHLGAGLLCVLATVMSAPAPAAAQDSSVDIVVSAVIPERCGFARLTSPLLSATTPDLEAAQVLNFTMPLDCNTPFAVGVIADQGALTNLTSRDDGSGYAFAKSYGVRITLDTSVGSVRSARCASTDIVAGGVCEFASDQAGQGLGSGEGVATPGGVTLTIDWPDQSTLNQRLAAGDYSDTITVVVGARA